MPAREVAMPADPLPWIYIVVVLSAAFVMTGGQ